jgi:hypothetical protein
MKNRYYFFNIEIALRKEDDSRIYAFENVSHIPTSKLIELFNINLEKDPYILEGYFLTKTNYKKHKKYIEQNIGQINLDVFEYCLRQYVTEDVKEIRKLYKESLLE